MEMQPMDTSVMLEGDRLMKKTAPVDHLEIPKETIRRYNRKVEAYNQNINDPEFTGHVDKKFEDSLTADNKGFGGYLAEEKELRGEATVDNQERVVAEDAHQAEVGAANAKSTFVRQVAARTPEEQQLVESSLRVQKKMGTFTRSDLDMTKTSMPTDEQMKATREAMSNLDRIQQSVVEERVLGAPLSEEEAELLPEDMQRAKFVKAYASASRKLANEDGALTDRESRAMKLQTALALRREVNRRLAEKNLPLVDVQEQTSATSDEPKEVWEVFIDGGSSEDIRAARRAELKRRFEEVDAKLENQNYVPTPEDKLIIRQYTSMRSRQLASAQSQESVGSTALAIPEKAQAGTSLAIPEKLQTGTALAIPEKLQTGTSLAVPEKPLTGMAVELHSKSPMRGIEDVRAAVARGSVIEAPVAIPGESRAERPNISVEPSAAVMAAKEAASRPQLKGEIPDGVFREVGTPELTDSQHVPHVEVEKVTGTEADEIRGFINKDKAPEIIGVEARIPGSDNVPNLNERYANASATESTSEKEPVALTMAQVVEAVVQRKISEVEGRLDRIVPIRLALESGALRDLENELRKSGQSEAEVQAQMQQERAELTAGIRADLRERAERTAREVVVMPENENDRFRFVTEHRADIEAIMLEKGIVDPALHEVTMPGMEVAVRSYYETPIPGDEEGLTPGDKVMKGFLAVGYVQARSELMFGDLGSDPEAAINARAEEIADGLYQEFLTNQVVDVVTDRIRMKAEHVERAVWALAREGVVPSETYSLPPVGISSNLDGVGAGRLDRMIERFGMDESVGKRQWLDIYYGVLRGGRITETEAVLRADTEFSKISVTKLEAVQPPALQQVELPPQPIHGGMPVNTTVELGELGPEGPLTKDQDRLRNELEDRGIDPYTAHRIAIGMTDERIGANLPEAPSPVGAELPTAAAESLVNEASIDDDAKATYALIGPKEEKVMRGVSAGVGIAVALATGGNPIAGAVAGALAGRGIKTAFNAFQRIKHDGLGATVRGFFGDLKDNYENVNKNIVGVFKKESYESWGRYAVNRAFVVTGALAGIPLGVVTAMAVEVTSPPVKLLSIIFPEKFSETAITAGIASLLPRTVVGLSELYTKHIGEAYRNSPEGRRQAGYAPGELTTKVFKAMAMAAVGSAVIATVTGLDKKLKDSLEKITEPPVTPPEEPESPVTPPVEPESPVIQPVEPESPVIPPVEPEPVLDLPASGEVTVSSAVGDVQNPFSYDAEGGVVTIGSTDSPYIGQSAHIHAWQRIAQRVAGASEDAIIGDMGQLADKLGVAINGHNVTPGLLEQFGDAQGWAELNGFDTPDAFAQALNVGQVSALKLPVDILQAGMQSIE